VLEDEYLAADVTLLLVKAKPATTANTTAAAVPSQKDLVAVQNGFFISRASPARERDCRG
jgi:hypothetical protein